jgi:transposase
MHPRSPHRRVHSAEFKSRVLAECRQPGASVSAISIAHGLNPNLVRKWLVGRGLKRTGLAADPRTVRPLPALQFMPVELAQPQAAPAAASAAAPRDIRIELDHGALRLQLQCPRAAGASYAAVLRALADIVAAG